jgi:hypothetical protein
MKKVAEEADILREQEKGPKMAEIKRIRAEEKKKKRGLNIEICSEVIDLIMDVADEAFEHQESQK